MDDPKPQQQEALPFDQDAELARVTSKMAQSILKFCRGRIRENARQFHAEDLRRYLSYDHINFAPGSPDRVLRNLRAKRLLDYVNVDRRNSLYELSWVADGN